MATRACAAVVMSEIEQAWARQEALKREEARAEAASE